MMDNLTRCPSPPARQLLLEDLVQERRLRALQLVMMLQCLQYVAEQEFAARIFFGTLADPEHLPAALASHGPFPTRVLSALGR